MTRPNVLLLMTDQHRAMSTGAYGSQEVHTPHLDRLATRSVVFERAYCAYPQCVASRQSMITGQHPNTHGAYGIDLGTIDTSQWTLQRAFTDAGYHTTLIGHPHMNETGFADSRTYHEYFERELTDLQRRLVAATWDAHPYVEAAKHAGPEDESEPWRCATYTYQETVRFLREWQPGSPDGPGAKPFYAWVTFQKPHPPFDPPSRFWNLYDSQKLTLPPVDPNRLRHDFWPEWIMQEEMVRNYLHGYYASISYADWCVGQILAEVDRLGLWRDTIVIYTSDHGENAGYHGTYEKHCFYEPSIRVPLMITAPGVEPSRFNQAVELVDLAPTLTDLCGVSPVGHRYEGASLRGPLHGQADGWKNRVFCEFEGGGPPRTWGRMLMEGHLKCCIEGNMAAPKSLFDLRSDPDEIGNLWDDPTYASQRDRMVRQINEGWRQRKYRPPAET